MLEDILFHDYLSNIENNRDYGSNKDIINKFIRRVSSLRDNAPVEMSNFAEYLFNLSEYDREILSYYYEFRNLWKNHSGYLRDKVIDLPLSDDNRGSILRTFRYYEKRVTGKNSIFTNLFMRPYDNVVKLRYFGAFIAIIITILVGFFLIAVGIYFIIAIIFGIRKRSPEAILWPYYYLIKPLWFREASIEI